MGLLDWLFGRKQQPEASSPAARFGLDELVHRLKMTPPELLAIKPAYRQFTIPKRSGGQRTILAPEPALKSLQRRILRRILNGLKAHPAAQGFERGHSILTNALPHAGKKVVLRMDLKDFFTSTTAKRVETYFRAIGWNAEAAAVLCGLCTHSGSLPQGAPTSPRLSNLLNYRLDQRLHALAQQRGCAYTRYADDITFSSASELTEGSRFDNPTTLRPTAEAGRINDLIAMTKRILAEEGYTLHLKQKLQIRRRHQRQQVTGLVVNKLPNLPRERRRWLRAIEHHLRCGKPITLTPQQLAGWRALAGMVEDRLEDQGNVE